MIIRPSTPLYPFGVIGFGRAIGTMPNLEQILEEILRLRKQNPCAPESGSARIETAIPLLVNLHGIRNILPLPINRL